MSTPLPVTLEDDVAWVERKYSSAAINKAGKTLIQSSDPVELAQARTIMGNWRAAHGYPMHALYCMLKSRSTKVAGGKGLLAQRRKRLVSIENKLRRRPNTRATQIQDIGGCRIIVPDIKHVHEMHALYLTSRSHVFKLHRTDDYIEYPKKNTGYRSLHLVYKYNSPQKPPWSNMRVELQIRSVYQHAWATAVEAVSFFTGQDLKAGEGDKGWLRFFLLMANWIAFEEGCSVVPGIPMEPKDFFEELESRYHESEPVNDNGTLYGIN